MPDIIYPDYQHCILNIVSSILAHYHASSGFPTISDLDLALTGNCQNVVLMVFDGMGTDMLKRNLPEESLLRRSIMRVLTSVYPCTTTAAMTSYYSGLSPLAHAWLGWSLYFKEFSSIIDAFPNRDSFTKQSAGDVHAAYSVMPYESIFEKIDRSENREVRSYMIVPSGITFPEVPGTEIRVENPDQIFENVQRLCSQPGRKFIMSYWYEPDCTAHIYGTYADQTRDKVEYIDIQTAALYGKMKDTLLIMSADHGLINIDREFYLNTIPEIEECLIMPPSIEPRAVSFFIKPDMKQIFAERFRMLFGSDFILYGKDEVINNHLLGYGIPHKKISDFIGDYLACATGSVMLRYRTMNGVEPLQYKAHHAGFRAEEMLVPLIILRA